IVKEGRLPNAIRDFRKARGWSLKELAARMGTSHANVSEIELGVIQLTLGYMRRFAAIFDVKPADLLAPEDRSFAMSPDEDRLIGRFRLGNQQQREQVLKISEI